jgi:hypothetical protein
VPHHIYLVESGSHGSLAIPTSDHEIVEWSFGDWYWYALGQQNYWRSPMILFWPSKGTLAKKTISYPQIISPELLARQLGAEKAWPLVVEKNAVLALHAQLEEEFSQGRDHRYDWSIATAFVVDHRRYSLAQTCNHVLKDWLVQLDCTIEGPFWVWDFDTQPPKYIPKTSTAFENSFNSAISVISPSTAETRVRTSHVHVVRREWNRPAKDRSKRKRHSLSRKFTTKLDGQLAQMPQ